MVHVVNRTGKDGSEDLEICEHGLERENEKEQARMEGWRVGRTKISLRVRAIDWGDLKREGP